MADDTPGKRKTRNASGSKLSDYLGTGKEFMLTEVPTLRGALRKALLIQETLILGDRRNLPVNDLMTEVATSVIKQWQISNNKLKPPVIVTNRALRLRLKTAWENVGRIARGKAEDSVKVKWDAKLDKLLDLTVCQCEIVLCTSSNSPCQGRKTCVQPGGGHITCSCTREVKLPVLELEWVYHQRAKVGEVSARAMVGVDVVETRKQEKTEKRKEQDNEIVLVNYRRRKEQDETLMSDKVTEPEPEPELEELSVSSPEPISSPVELPLCISDAELTRVLAGQNPEGKPPVNEYCIDEITDLPDPPDLESS